MTGLIIAPKAAASPEAGASGQNTFTVPVESLAQPDDQEQMQTPEQGDSVNLQVDAVVESIDGDMATIKVNAINGKPLEGTPEEESQDQEEGEGAGETGMTSPDDAENQLRAAMGGQQ